ncbi:hypothetical protein T01_13097 [Trichinella spiralis]|uniref:Uncharacterized protein n=1 Tax=Trichinella spiralis TaxID=6334 RepID=A0A0V0ZS88_TRISP|nr:hypothetical protein T01_13097 [Trichinella spiralis]
MAPFLIGRIEQCISLIDIVSWYILELIFTKKFQCTKTSFQHCAMQITITIKVPYRQLECT